MSEQILGAERRISVFGQLAEIVREVSRYRELLIELTRRDLRIRYTQAIMGVAWAVLTPLVVALSGWIIRLGISYMSGFPLARAELAGIAIKGVGWSFFVGAIGFGTASIAANSALVAKVYFPREVIPLSAVATQVVDTSVGTAALILLLPFLGFKLSSALLWVPLLILLLIALTTGITLLVSCANVFYRDAKHVVHLLISFGIFFTPVFFNAASFGPRGSRMLLLNPLGTILEGFRLAIVEGHSLSVPLHSAGGALIWSPALLGWAAAWAVGGTALAALIFHRAELDFAEFV